MLFQTPESSGQIGIEIGNALGAMGKQVFGWDLEWNTDWSTNRPKYGGRTMFDRLETNSRGTKIDRKTVLLMHDYAFRTSLSGQDFDFHQLDEFIDLVLRDGYVFSTLDKYLLDDPYSNTQAVVGDI